MATLRILPALDSPAFLVKPEASTFPDLDAFVDYLRVERGASGNTIASYKFDLLRFLTFIRERSHTPASADRDDFHAYIASLQDSGLHGNSVARHFQATRSFYKFLRYSGVARKDPTRRVRAPRFRLSLVDGLTDGEVDKIIAHLSEEPERATRLQTAIQLRNHAIVQTFYGSGLRVSELTGLRLEDLMFPEMMIRVIGKGDKQRLAVMSPPQATALVEYLRRGRRTLLSNHKESGALFLAGPGGRRGGGYPLSRQMVFCMIRDIGRLVLDRSIHPHQIRHSFGTTLVSHGADLRNVQALMGHADIDTTMRYIHVDMREVLATHSTTHPRG